MALGTQSASIGGAAKSLIVGLDPNGNLAAAHVNVSSSGVEMGTGTNPFTVIVGNLPASQPISAVSLPLPAGAATSANQPSLNPDGGALSHIVNFPPSQPVTLVTLPALAAGSNVIGAVTQASGPWAVTWSGQTVAATQSGLWTTALASGSSVSLSAGSAAIGSVSVNGAVAVTGAFYQTTQPVSAAALPLPAGAAQDGSDASGITAPPGATGIRGWLSGIYGKLAGTLSVGIATALPAGSNIIGAVTGSGVTGATPVGAPISVSGIDAGGLKQHLRTDTFGTPTDSPWSSGGGSLVALGKAMVAAQQATTAAVTGSSLVPPSPTFVQTTALASNLVLKAAAGSLYACYVTTGSTAGWMMIFDAIAAPANGTVAPKDCIYCPANATTEIELPFLTAEPFATGITAVFSSTGPFTLTASSTAFIKGIVQ